MSFCKRRCKGTAIFSNYQIIPYYIIYFFVGLHSAGGAACHFERSREISSSNIFSKTVLSSEAGTQILQIAQ